MSIRCVSTQATTAPTEEVLSKDGVLAKFSYTVTDEIAVEQGNVVVATVNGRELTNGALQIFFKMQVADFLNTNAAYLSYMGLDYTKSLSTQTCYYDESLKSLCYKDF